MTEIALREPRVADHAAVADLLNRAYPTEPQVSADTVAWAYRSTDPERPQACLVAERGGSIIGSGFLRGLPTRPGLMLNVEVLPEHRRQGLGTRLLEALVGAIGPTTLDAWTFVSEENLEGRAFLARHGFVERDRMFESMLDLAAFEADAYADLHEQLARRGIRLSVFSAEDSPELRHRLHELAERLDRDVPSVEPLQPSTYEEWVSSWLEAPHSRRDLIALAFDGDEPVAVSSIAVLPDGTAINHMTGVQASHRGQSLGLAVKVEALRLAQASGITEVRTDNHIRNAPMLAINARLGYRRRPTYIELARPSRATVSG